MFKIPDVQEFLNEQLAKFPAASKYVENVTYLPKDTPPDPTAFTFTIAGPGGADKVQIAFSPKGFYSTLLGMLLKLL